MPRKDVVDGPEKRREGSLSRREFLRRGSAGLAGAALLGSGALAGCGGGGGQDSGNLVYRDGRG